MPQECFSDLYMDMQICAGAVRQHMDGSQQTATGKGEQHTADLEELTLFLTNCVGHSLVAPSDAESLAYLAYYIPSAIGTSCNFKPSSVLQGGYVKVHGLGPW